MNELEELKFKVDSIKISEENYSEYKNTSFNNDDYSQIKKDLYESEPLKQLKGLIGLRKLLSQEIEKLNPINFYDDINLLFNFVENYPEEFKYESLLCLEYIEKINLDIYDCIKNVPNDNIIKIMLYILDFPKKFKYQLIEPDLNYIDVLVSDLNFKDKIGVEKLYLKLKNIIEKEYPNDINILKKSIDILVKIFKYKELESKTNYILDLISLINEIIIKFESNQNLLESSLLLLYTLSHDNTVNPLIMKKIIEINILPKLIKYMDLTDINKNKDKILYSLRIIGNLASMEDSYYTDKIIESKALNILKELMDKKYSQTMRTEATWIISNIAAGTEAQINKLYENNIHIIIMDIILNGTEDKIKNNCLWALYNFSNLKNSQYLDDIVEKGFLDIIIKRFKIDTGNTLACSLEALNNLLNYGKTKDPANFNIIESKLNELNILNELKILLNKNDEEVCKKGIIRILTSYFGIEDINKFQNEENDNNL